MTECERRYDPNIGLPFLTGCVFAVCLLFYYSHLSIFGTVALVAFIASPLVFLVDVRERQEIALFSILVLVAIVLRANVSDFSLFVGDASAYTWDAVLAIEEGVDRGFFLPLSSAVAAVGYAWFGLEYVAFGNIFTAVFSSFLLYRIVINLTSSKTISFAAAAMLVLHPLSIWFSKTAFSETGWQCIVLACLLAVQGLRREQFRFGIIALGLLLALSAFSRGTAPFLFTTVLVGVLLTDAIPLRNRIVASLALSAVFLTSLATALYIREPYLIGWQYARVMESITSFGVVSVVAGVTVAVIMGVALFTKRIGRLAAMAAMLVGLIGVKVASAVALSEATRMDDLLVRNELSLAIANFGVQGVAFALIGMLAMLNAAMRGNIAFLVVIAGYCLSTVPFNLVDLPAESAHEVVFYWSRYFYSDMFVYYVVAIVTGLSATVRWLLGLTPLRIRVSGSVIHGIGILLVFTGINWNAVLYASQTGYLDGSSQLMEFVRDTVKGRDAVVLADSKLRYGPYGPEPLLRGLPIFAPSIAGVKSVQTSKAAELGDSYRRVVCINLQSCESDERLVHVADFQKLISWDAQRFDYLDIVHKQTLWSVGVYDYCPAYGQRPIEINLSNSQCLNSAEVLADGWHNLESGHVWSSKTATLRLTVPAECLSTRCLARLTLSAFAASPSRPVSVEVKSPVASVTHVFADAAAATIEVPLPGTEVAEIGLRIDDATSPVALKLSSDRRVLGVAFYRYSIHPAK